MALLLAGCSAAERDQPATPAPTPGLPAGGAELLTMAAVFPSDTLAPPKVPTAPPPTLRPTATLDLPPDPEACVEQIDRHVRQEPYERAEGHERYTLSAEEYTAYLELLGIESLCIPAGFGAPYLNVDWNGFANPGLAIGRMVSIGFERLDDGLSGWSRGYLLYSTYDFEIGTMYQDFAEPEDLAAVRAGAVANPIEVDGVDGFTRYVPGFVMGGQDIAKTYVFPFHDYYVAAVLVLRVYPVSEVQDHLRAIEAGTHPDLQHRYVELMDRLVASIEFR